MRWRAKQLSSFYVSRIEEDRELSAADIAAMLQESSKALAARIRKSAATLTGTPPYWGARSRELSAMIRQIGTPHAFVTHSAADIQWPDLHVHMPSHPDPGATEAERQRFNYKSINENPALAAWWFQRRSRFGSTLSSNRYTTSLTGGTGLSGNTVAQAMYTPSSG